MQQSPTFYASICALHDGHAGNARQARALAQALDVDAQDITLHPSLLVRWLAPRRWPLFGASLGPGFRAKCESPPALAIGCGRQAALATRLLRVRGSRAVQILDPRIASRYWDVVVAPAHDRLRGDNVITTLGSLNPVNDDWLLCAISTFPELAMLPTPHTVLLVGGPTAHAPLQTADFTRLLQRLATQVRAECGSLSAIASRRTPAAWRAALGGLDRRLPGLRWCDTGDGTNPYAGLLANADRLICTPDSVNMLSEAAATYAPLFIWEPQAVRGRLCGFIDTLLAAGRARLLDATMTPFEAPPLRETERVAREIQSRLM